jgi:hypothetical protein
MEKKLIYPKTVKDFKSFIDNTSPETLKQLGFELFTIYDKHDKTTHYLKSKQRHFLYPKDWYNYIPNGTIVIDIFGKTETFKRDVSDDGCYGCYGCLPYGFIK